MLFDEFALLLPFGLIDAEQFVKVFSHIVDSVEVEVFLTGHEADGRFHAFHGVITAVEDPFEYTDVVAVTGPEPFAVVVFAEPVDVEYFGQVFLDGAFSPMWIQCWK